MLYVTADRQFPLTAINESVAEFSTKCEKLARQFPMQCSWLPWLDVADAFENSTEPFLRDVAALCQKLDLVPFRGIAPIAAHYIAWSYEESRQPFNFEVQSIQIGWKYQ
jgi:hypothetical protein